MTENEIRATYPDAEALYSLLESKKIELVALPLTKKLDSISFREIEFICHEYSCIIPVDDEYNDASLGNTALLLQLILFSIEEYEDCDDFLVWSTAFGLNASDSFSLDLYKQTGEVAPKIRAIIGANFNGVSDFDWQLNAGTAQALRGLST
tara:strand:- start:63498 stop:63950 length:453 start_codon:yes stop_codon:yes gene_type:complete